jgi:catechol 2,3-dioxygenase-like lactoylglutathione lyase family enzyme
MTIEKCAGRAARYAADDCTPVFDHIAVWAEDTEATAHFLTNVMGWRRHPTVIRVSDEEKTTGGMIGTFFDAPGLWIELIEPTTPGPGQDILDQLGDGALVEINFDLGDAYGLALERLAARGIEMLSMDGSPLKDGGTIDEGVFEGDEIQNPGQRIAYFPTELTGGTTVEYYEVLSDDEGSLIHERDRVWRNEQRAPGTPWVDHVAIVTDDAARAAAFFSDHMGLQAGSLNVHADGSRSILVDANGADEKTLWLRLLEPAPGSREAAILAARGPGHILEFGVVVEDLASFAKHAASLGTGLVDDSGEPAANPAEAGDAWFASADSRGIPIHLRQASIAV